MDCGADTKNTLKASWVVGQEYFNALAPSNRMTLPGPVIGYISTALHHSIFDSVIAKPHYARNFLHHWENEMRGIWFPTRCTNKKYLQWSCVVNENLWRIIFTVILWKKIKDRLFLQWFCERRIIFTVILWNIWLLFFVLMKIVAFGKDVSIMRAVSRR